MPSDTLTTALDHHGLDAIEQHEPRTPVALLQSDAALQMIAESLPKGMDAATFQRHAITLVKQTPKLMECEAATVAQGIVRGAALGLDPDPALGQMWLVPRNVKAYNPATRKDEWSSVATFQVGFRGLHELAMRSGRLAKVEVKAVHEHDHFEARLGSKGGLDHQPDWFGDRGEVIGWYAYAQLKDGTETFEVLSRAAAESHRDAFAPKKKSGEVYGPWVDHFEAMAMKTVFIKLAKWLPKSVEVSEAMADDGKSWRQPLGAAAHRGDVIEASHTPVAAAELPAPVVDPEPEPEASVEPEPVAADPEPAVVASGVTMAAGLPLADENGDPILASSAVEVPAGFAARNRKAQAMVAEAWDDLPKVDQEKRRKGLVSLVSSGRTESSKDLTDAEWDALFDGLESIKDGRQTLHLRSNGAYELRRVVGRS